MSNFTEEEINQVWEKGSKVLNYNAEKFRKDVIGAWMVREAYGQEGLYGWEIDHVYPESKGGDDTLINLRPMQWQNNRSKQDDYPIYKSKIKSDGKDNIEANQSCQVNNDLQEKLKDLYNI